MVSIMNEALQLEVGHKVLEVGAGSGWHAATIAEIVAPSGTPRSKWGHVYTVEVVQGLTELGRNNIMKAGYSDRVSIIGADGSMGHSEQAPYDRILVTAAAPEIPNPLVEQLKPNGIMLIPVGSIQGLKFSKISNQLLTDLSRLEPSTTQPGYFFWGGVSMNIK